MFLICLGFVISWQFIESSRTGEDSFQRIDRAKSYSAHTVQGSAGQPGGFVLEKVSLRLFHKQNLRVGATERVPNVVGVLVRVKVDSKINKVRGLRLWPHSACRLPG